MNVRGALRTGLSTAAAGAMLVAVAGPAQASSASTVLSQSTARVLNGSIAGTDLGPVVELAGTEAKNYGGATVTKDVTPDVAALNKALVVPLGQVKTSLGNAIPGVSLQGLVQQKVTARANGSSAGTASTAGLGLDLGTLTGGATDALTKLTVSLGVLTAHAAEEALPSTKQTGSCTVAGLTLDLTSPLLAQIVGQVSGALSPTLTTLQATLLQVINSANLVLPPGTLAISGIPSLASITSQLTSVATPDGSISIDLTNGKVHVDLAKLLGTAGLDFCADPNSKPLAQLGTALANQIPKLIKTLVDGAVKTATDLLKFCTTAQETGCLRLTVGGTDVASLVLAPALNQLTSALSTATDAITSGIGQVTGALGGLLGQLADALAGVLDITTNLQSTSGGTFRETALQLQLLKAAGSPVVELNLATATVGPSAAAPTTTPPPSTPPTTTPGTPIKVDAGRAGPADDGSGISPLWVGLLLIAGGAGGAVWLRRRAPGHL